MLGQLGSRYKIEETRSGRFAVYKRNILGTIFFWVLSLASFGFFYLLLKLDEYSGEDLLWEFISVRDTYEEAYERLVEHRDSIGDRDLAIRYFK